MYIKKAFWPSGMAPELPHRGASLAAWQVAGSLALLIAITVLVLVYRRYRYLPVGWLWFVGTLVPMIGILQAGHQGMADRFGYNAYPGTVHSGMLGRFLIGRGSGIFRRRG